MAIRIPSRIHRTPTDLLKALSYTANNSQYIMPPKLLDDGTLLPQRCGVYRTLLKSKLSGVATAKYLLDKHPEMFYRDHSEPKIAAFSPPEKFTEDMALTQDDLINSIKNLDVVNSCIAYQKLKLDHVQIENKVLADMLELVCYSNEDAVNDIHYFENEFLSASEPYQDLAKWKDAKIAKQIFDELLKANYDVKRIYSAIIAGLAKWRKCSSALGLYDQFKQKHKQDCLSIDAYSSLIRGLVQHKYNPDNLPPLLDEICIDLNRNNIKPSLEFFNSILIAQVDRPVRDHSYILASKIINEMTRLGINPSLATYLSLIEIAARTNQRDLETLIRYVIIEVGQNCNLYDTVRDPHDLRFFLRVMFILADLGNLNLANNLNSLKCKFTNFFPSFYLKKRYYSRYFRLLLSIENLDNIKKFYESHIQYEFVPSLQEYDMLITVMDSYQADNEFIERVVNDLIGQNLIDKISNVHLFIKSESYRKAVERQKMK